MDIASYVLQEFRRSELDAISAAIDESIAVIDSCLALGLEKAVSGSRL
jgi:peptidyl-tRNA hydrolase